ncbi:MAG: DUF3365 domain-containing protein, partial [Candidatus Omnitrophica bacterium]|nr:DUF3365 domain-containing protein [Candidatus Omnitrophota bacterium]
MKWFERLSLQYKVILFIVISLAFSQIIGSIIFIKNYEKNVQEEMFFKAKAIAQMAENARTAAGEALSAYDGMKIDEMLAEAAEDLKGLPVGSDAFWQKLRNSRYYNVGIPVVWSFKAAREGAEESNFQFTPVRFNPRNMEHAPKTNVEKELLKDLDTSNKQEVSAIDKEHNVLRYMRPVVLSQDCLVCHGGAYDDPKRPNTMVDPVGFPKDGKKVGDRHGAFEIIMDLMPMY